MKIEIEIDKKYSDIISLLEFEDSFTKNQFYLACFKHGLQDYLGFFYKQILEEKIDDGLCKN